jgi:hypothetical protein
MIKVPMVFERFLLSQIDSMDSTRRRSWPRPVGVKRDRSHASEFVRQTRVDKIEKRSRGKVGSFIRRMRPSLYTDDRQCESHPEYMESISKYTSTSEDERTGMLKVKGSRSMRVVAMRDTRRCRRRDRTFTFQGSVALTLTRNLGIMCGRVPYRLRPQSHSNSLSSSRPQDSCYPAFLCMHMITFIRKPLHVS